MIDFDNETKYYVTFCDDVEPNVGGFYCAVYTDEELNNEIGNFVIDKELCIGDTRDERLDKAEAYARTYMKEHYGFE